MNKLRALCLLLSACGVVGAQLITTVAGTEFAFPADPLPAVEAPLGDARDVALGPDGTLYIADQINHLVLQVDLASGTLSRFAGNGFAALSGDGGAAAAASLRNPRGVAVDLAGNVYIADFGNSRVRRVDPQGTITTLARVTNPNDVAVSSTGEVYAIDTGGGGVRVIRNGAAEAVPGLDNLAGAPIAIALDAADNIYVAAANLVRAPPGGGAAVQVLAGVYAGVAVDPAGNVHFSDRRADQVFILEAGGPRALTATAFDNPGGLAVDPQNGDVYLADRRRVWRIRGGTAEIVAGNGTFRFTGDGGPATSAGLSRPVGLAITPQNELLVADSENHAVRRVSNGIMGTTAGNGVRGSSGDGGPADAASLAVPLGLAVEAGGGVLVADSRNDRVRRVDGGTIATFAGTTRGDSGDGGPAIAAQLSMPADVAVDPATGTALIADTFNDRIRAVDAGGMIAPFAGTGRAGFAGDGGDATQARLSFPSGVSVGPGSVTFIADTENHRIRRVAGGIIQTIAGSGFPGFLGDGGAAADSELNAPEGVFALPNGDVLIADTGNNRIRLISDGVISTVAGSGEEGFAGDGRSALMARLNTPRGVTADADGNVLFSDTANNRVRAVLATPPSFRLETTEVVLEGRSLGRPFTRTVGVEGDIPGLAFEVAEDENAPWLSVDPVAGLTPENLQLRADPGALTPGSYDARVVVMAPDANPAAIGLDVTFEVSDAGDPRAEASPSELAFTLLRDAEPAIESVSIRHLDGAAFDFDASVETDAGGVWLSVAPTSGRASPEAPSILRVTADPAGLETGTYTGRVTLEGGARPLEIPVVLTVTAVAQTILLSNDGLTFRSVVGGGAGPAQTVGVLNIGRGVMSWRASAEAFDGGSWLRVTPSRGQSDAGSREAPLMSVSVDPSGLEPGEYFGEVEVRAEGAMNSPQTTSVVLSLLPEGSRLPPDVTPTNLVFVGVEGRDFPGSQEIRFFNRMDRADTFRTIPEGARYDFLPTDATVRPDEPLAVQIQPRAEGLSAGIFRDDFAFQFERDVVRVSALLIMLPSPAAGIKTLEVAQSACSPTRLLPLFTRPVASLSLSFALPNALNVSVFDDCGEPLTSGTVSASFSNGDAAIDFIPVGDGIWKQSWTPRRRSDSVTVTKTAADPMRGLSGETATDLPVFAGDAPQPKFSSEGVVSAASFVAGPIAPGAIVSIFGENLHGSDCGAAPQPPCPAASDTPLPEALDGTSVILADAFPLPLLFASPGQINAVVPWNVEVDQFHPMRVFTGGARSTTVRVRVGAAQPAVFVQNASTGQGHVYVAPQQTLAAAGSPARAGDTVIVFATGLGRVDPPLADGDPAPLDRLLHAVTPVRAWFGDRPATPLFSGLAPGFVGLNQVNLTIPEEAPTGDAVSLQLEAGGLRGPQVVMAIR